MAFAENNTGGRHVQPEPKHRRDQKQAGKGREVQRALGVHRHHQDQQRDKDVRHEEGVEKKYGKREHHHGDKREDADRQYRAARQLLDVIEPQSLKCHFHDALPLPRTVELMACVKKPATAPGRAKTLKPACQIKFNHLFSFAFKYMPVIRGISLSRPVRHRACLFA